MCCMPLCSRDIRLSYEKIRRSTKTRKKKTIGGADTTHLQLSTCSPGAWLTWRLFPSPRTLLNKGTHDQLAQGPKPLSQCAGRSYYLTYVRPPEPQSLRAHQQNLELDLFTNVPKHKARNDTPSRPMNSCFRTYIRLLPTIR